MLKKASTGNECPINSNSISLTNSLFPTAWLFPGQIDRKIEFPLPDEKTKRRIFSIHTSRMTVADDVTLDELILAILETTSPGLTLR